MHALYTFYHIIVPHTCVLALFRDLRACPTMRHITIYGAYDLIMIHYIALYYYKRVATCYYIYILFYYTRCVSIMSCVCACTLACARDTAVGIIFISLVSNCRNGSHEVVRCALSYSYIIRIRAPFIRRIHDTHHRGIGSIDVLLLLLRVALVALFWSCYYNNIRYSIASSITFTIIF